MPDLLKKFAFVIQAALVGLGLAFLWILIRGDGLAKQEIKQPEIKPQMSFADAVARAAPAVVSIQTLTVPGQNNPLSRWSRRRTPQRGLGSGVIVDSDGLILTNYHVIRDVDSILVILPDGRNSIAKTVGVDEETDLALLKLINAGGVKLDLPTLSFANSREQKIGDVVLAIGNPYGIGQTVTQGIISATGRANIDLADFEDFIQTDANISEGNSGGALVNTRGELIGINTAVFSAQGENSGIGFAIPADLANGVLQAILQNGRVIRGWLGINTGAYVDSNGNLVDSKLQGAIVGQVFRNSPAAAAGIQPYDILLSVNNAEINSNLEAKYTIASLKPGDKVTLRIRRGNEVYNVSTVVAERPSGIS